jgi:alpha-beta hydrolase superfamily lysophospholipase
LVRLGVALALVLVTVLAVRAWDAWRSPPLSLWHTQVPEEPTAREIDASDWMGWLSAESLVFEQVRKQVTDKLPGEDRIAANRFFFGSPLYPPGFHTNWNRSYLQMPTGQIEGAVVLLHGLTDSPYSLRHIGDFYRESRFVVVAIRLPGHGTVPAGLTEVRWEDWAAATRLAVRHARSIAGDDKPLHLVGYSNGAALAMEYTLAAMDDNRLPKPDQLVLFSPMVGITSFARFAGVLGWPAVFPAFAKSAWLDTLPEYNPFKYNSFPVNAARQSSQLIDAVRGRLLERVKRNGMEAFPRVLAFQSVVDSTVSSRAVVDDLFALLPANGSELVMFDRNRAASVGPLARPDSTAVLDELGDPATRRFRLTVITGTEADPSLSEARTTSPGQTGIVRHPLSRYYPKEMYSLSHVALPFPVNDALYGIEPGKGESYGVQLGTVAVRGERGILVVSMETLMRASCNPFFDYQLERIAVAITGRETARGHDWRVD